MLQLTERDKIILDVPHIELSKYYVLELTAMVNYYKCMDFAQETTYVCICACTPQNLEKNPNIEIDDYLTMSNFIT